MRKRSLISIGVAFVFAASLSACTGSPSVEPSPSESPAPEPTPVPSQVEGSTATWELLGASDVNVDSISLEVGVKRLECASGVTGELLDPVIVYESAHVIITIDAAPNALGSATCQGNDVVPVTVELSEPLGERKLIDGACLPLDMQKIAPCLTSERASAPSS